MATGLATRLMAEVTALSEAVTMFASIPTPHTTTLSSPCTDLALHVRRGERVTTCGQRMLGVVEHPYVVIERGDGVDERRYRAVPLARDRLA